MSDITNCASDFDCGADNSLICYRNVSWLADGESFCGCSSWYGWKDEASGCEGRTAQYYIATLISVGALIFALSGFAAGVYSLVQLAKVKTGKSKVNPISITTFATTAALFCVSMWTIVNIAISNDPQDQTEKLSSRPGEKFHPFVTLDRILFFGLSLFTTFAAMSMSLTWVQIAQESKQLRNKARGIDSYKQLNITFQVGYGFLVVVVLALNQPVYIPLVSLPFFLFVIITSLVGQRKMVMLLEDMSVKSSGGNTVTTPTSSSERNTDAVDPYKKIARDIRTTAFIVSGGTSVFLFFSIMFSILGLGNWQEYSKYEGISWIVLCISFAIVGGVVLLLGIQRYCYINVMARVRKSRRESGLQPYGGSSFATSNQNEKSSFSTLAAKASSPHMTEVDVDSTV